MRRSLALERREAALTAEKIGAFCRVALAGVPETAIAQHLDSAHEFATRLRALGCSFALDDFGVGHGTFTAIIGVAKQYGIKTIAEGVEDQATLGELQRMGADYAQGFWIGRPAPFHELSQLSAVQGQA